MGRRAEAPSIPIVMTPTIALFESVKNLEPQHGEVS